MFKTFAVLGLVIRTARLCIVQFQRISILLPQKGLEFPGGWDSVRPKNFKKCMKLNWNFQRGGGLRNNISSMGR